MATDKPGAVRFKSFKSRQMAVNVAECDSGFIISGCPIMSTCLPAYTTGMAIATRGPIKPADLAALMTQVEKLMGKQPFAVTVFTTPDAFDKVSDQVKKIVEP